MISIAIKQIPAENSGWFIGQNILKLNSVGFGNGMWYCAISNQTKLEGISVYQELQFACQW